MKIVLIGAGSASFGRGQIVDILRAAIPPDGALRGAELALVDENGAALDAMHGLATRICDHLGSEVRLTKAVDRCEALPGADYVIIAVERRRMELWEQDFRMPLAYGFRHIMGENGGPGALFHALRTIDLIVPMARDMERLCPNAWLLNFTNPEMRVLHAVSHLTSVRAAGFCHGVFSALDSLSRYLGRSRDDLHVVSAGINHFYAILSVRDKSSDEELLPKALEQARRDDSAPPLFRLFAETFDVFTFPSDDHIGEYLAWGTEYHGSRWPFGREAESVPLHDPAPRPSVRDYADGTVALDDGILAGTGELTVPIVSTIETGSTGRFDAVNVLNSDGFIVNLPRSAAVEVPAIVDSDGIHPEHVGLLPEAFAAILRTQTSIAELVTQAYRTRSRKVLLQALLVDPVVDSVAAAERLLNEMLVLQRDYLPEFD